MKTDAVYGTDSNKLKGSLNSKWWKAGKSNEMKSQWQISSRESIKLIKKIQKDLSIYFICCKECTG